MKIQDIFNLQKNRGGAKLFDRIMNRYGIPKEDSKELKNNIDNSSSGGGENTGKIEYLYIKLNSIGSGTNLSNNVLPVGYKIVQVIGSYSTFSPVVGSTITVASKYNTFGLMLITKLYSLSFLAIKLLKINEDDCDATSLAAIVEKYPNWSICEEITKEEYESLITQ